MIESLSRKISLRPVVTCIAELGSLVPTKLITHHVFTIYYEFYAVFKIQKCHGNVKLTLGLEYYEIAYVYSH